CLSRIAQQPTAPPPLEPLGAFLGGDLYEWVYGDQLCISPEEFERHMVVVGEPGYGKTMTLLRLASIAVRYGKQVLYIDLKG
uniref:ATP-binding protein n=1 Tax=Salmonella sp. SAL04269 TaxID=3159847 RepID=UPI00397D3225